MDLHAAVLGEIWSAPTLAEDFDLLTECGGRLAGSESESRARELLMELLSTIPDLRVSEHRFDYPGWSRRGCSLEILGPPPRSLPCHALIWSPDSPPRGLEAEVVDVGRGTLQEFEAVEKRIKGRIVLVRHEYPFASGTIHRRLKYNWSRERGAAGFVIANNLPGNMLVTGSVGQDLSDNIPAVGVSLETGSVLENGRRDRFQGVRLSLRSERRAATGVNLIAEVPGRGPEWVVVCAHYDGHDLAQSALDNATGVVTVLQILRSIGPHVSRLPRGLRAILFTAEEWSLLGSRRYVDQLSDGMCRGISVVVNLDTIAGSSRLACLTSGFEELNAFVERVGIDIGYHFRPVLPVMRNSDHFNFVQRGVPAMRVVAGFDEPDAGGRFLLTSGDTCDKVPSGELKTAALAAAELVWCALTWSGSIARHKTPDEVKGLLGSIS